MCRNHVVIGLCIRSANEYDVPDKYNSSKNLVFKTPIGLLFTATEIQFFKEKVLKNTDMGVEPYDAAPTHHISKKLGNPRTSLKHIGNKKCGFKKNRESTPLCVNRNWGPPQLDQTENLAPRLAVAKQKLRRGQLGVLPAYEESFKADPTTAVQKVERRAALPLCKERSVGASDIPTAGFKRRPSTHRAIILEYN